MTTLIQCYTVFNLCTQFYYPVDVEQFERRVLCLAERAEMESVAEYEGKEKPILKCEE